SPSSITAASLPSSRRWPSPSGRLRACLESSPSNGCPESARDARPLVDDLLIRGGLVIDGTGAPGREADVSVSAGRIGAIAPRSERPARRVIDARGQVVAPGFIDIHTHSDFTLPLNPRAESKIRQGVTLEVVGNCGFSVARALRGRAAMLREYLTSTAPWLPFGETSFADYVAAFPSTALNVILQVGHNTDAVREAIAVAEATGVRVQIAHL